ncbi:18188_t:CDS:1, partial [Gigaspora margarita]
KYQMNNQFNEPIIKEVATIEKVITTERATTIEKVATIEKEPIDKSFDKRQHLISTIEQLPDKEIPLANNLISTMRYHLHNAISEKTQ